MGVHGLWRLIEPSGKPVPLESLENKVLAIDVSIWLHHFIKGFQDSKGAPLPNAHLLGIYHRVCKLLYFRIKPVFVFDGGVPVLKKQTIALRNQRKHKNLTEADRIHKNLLSALVKHTAISKVLSEKTKAEITAATSPTKNSRTENDELYVLPSSQLDSTVSSDEENSADGTHPSRIYDLHSIDTGSAEFKALPVDVRHEILTDLKDTRKQSSWGRLHELPTESDDFATYQMKRLLKRQSVQTALEDVEKEMGGHSLSLGELEKLLKDQGVISNLKGSRIASDENTRFLLIKDIKQAIEEAKNQNLQTIEEKNEENGEVTQGDEEFEDEEKNEEVTKTLKSKGDVEFEDDLNKAIALSLEGAPSTSKEIEPSTSEVKKIGAKGKSRMPLSFLADFEDADFDDSESSEEETVPMRLTPARSYMREYSGLTPSEIAKILASKSGAEEVKKVGNNDTKPKENKIMDKVDDKSKAIEVMSDSGSSSSDDFVDVEESNKKKTTESMEVVIKPGEELDDDLFKDVFVEEVNLDSAEGNIEETQEKITSESLEVVVNPDENLEDDLFQDVFADEAAVSSNAEKNNTAPDSTVAEDQVKTTEVTEGESKSTSQSLRDKIQKMIQNYSDPKEKETEAAPKLSVEQLNEMKANLRREQIDLTVEKSNKERLAGNITDQMYQESQELLELFGLPYVIAPMEAEAQCAFLELIDLTDGTITDDSDIWLFGGRTVYKNFFNQNKIVMEFKSERIQQSYKLSREQMILLAMLVGSDYTVGLPGVGPVTALEILAAFPPKNHLVSGLTEFKSWFSRGKLPGPGRTSLRGKLKNLSFTEHFPNPQIAQAYLEPPVETSKEKFTWGKPDVVGLVDFARQKFGWNKTKTEEILNPVLKRLEETKSQKTITEYFKHTVKVDSGEAEKMMSKRVKSAINKIGKEDTEEEEPKAKKRRGKKKPKEDEEIRVLKETEARSQLRVKEIENEVHKEVNEKKVDLHKRFHKKEVIPQKQKDKSQILKNKLKAIETFRKSKQGPGYVKKRGKKPREAKSDAGYLSESSNSD